MNGLYFLVCLVTLLACTVGRICGIGGGVIIKPVLDGLGLFSIESINFYSACTVAAMAGWSVIKSLRGRSRQIDLRISTPLAVGAALGGFAGKSMFSGLAALFADPNTAGGVQAALLFALTFMTLIYTLKKDRIRGFHTSNLFACALIGFVLGALGAFLGIGGGPFNMAALYLFFSMPTKQAAENSLYVILISQIAALLKTAFSASIPVVMPFVLIGMILCGIAGSELGSYLNKRLSDRCATKTFEAVMLLVMAVCCYNYFKYTA